VNVHSKRSGDLSVVLAGAQAPSSRWIEALPACELPLSTIQNTVRADAYGSLVITCSTRRPNGLTPVFGSTRSKGLAWWTSPPSGEVRQRAVAAVLELDQRRAVAGEAPKKEKGAGWGLLSSPLGSMAA